VKITGVRSVLYEYELSRPIGDANIRDGITRRADLAVFVDTDEGLEGVTIAPGIAESQLPFFAGAVIGEDPRAVRGLWQRMVDAVFKVGNAGAATAAIAAIDCALWDLKAKIGGIPLWRELGATGRHVKAYASGLDMPLDDEQLRAFYRRAAAQGMTGGKLKVGLDPDADLRRLAIMQDALGGRASRPSLMVDANEYWSPKQAIRRMAEIEREFEITWCEEPARRWDYRGLRQVSRAIRAAVASGENLREPSEFVPLLRHEAVDLVQLSLTASGISGALRVADLAHSLELPVTMNNCPGRFAAHLAAALPHHLMMEVLDAGRDAVFSYDSTIDNCWIVLGDTPGSGITFDPERLARHRVDAPDPAAARTFSGRGPLAGVREGPPDQYPPEQHRD
jgi:L-alanine-DL-glutamate epimerase-like enolase superfamily enzyme